MFDSLQIRRRLFAITAALALMLLALPIASAGQTASLDAGYRQMYNLDFGGAHKTFQAWEQQHPQDPLGPISNAAAYLFSEFDRLHILEVELFTNDEALKNRQKVSADPVIRAGFDSELQKGDRLASDLLSRSPDSQDALFSKALEN